MFSYYLYKAVWPMLAVLGASLIALMIVLWGVSAIEAQKGHPGVFDVELRAFSDAPLWLMLLAGMLVVNGITMARWAVVSADVGRRRVGYGYEVNVPFPIGKMAAVNILYIGISIVVFFAVRMHMWR